MAQILKFPVPASALGYKRVRKRPPAPDDPAQLSLFPRPAAETLAFCAGLSFFEEALLLDERGDIQASEFYLKAIAEQDCVADAYCNLGIIESQRGNTARALDCFAASLKHDPRHSLAHYNLGNLYFEVNDFRLAQVHYEMAGDLDPSFANVFFNLALVLAINNDFGAAVSALRKYREFVSPEEGQLADDLLRQLQKALVAARIPGSRLAGGENS